MEPVEILSTPTYDDCRIFYRWTLFHKSRNAFGFFPFYGAIGVTLAVPAIVETARSGIAHVSTFAAICVVLGLALGAVLLYLWRAYTVTEPRRYFDGLNAYGPIRYRFTETSVTTSSELRNAEYDWTRFTRRIELPTLHVLVIGDAIFYFMIAKRDVPDAARERFERLISRLPRARTLR